jgi:hypothetical protein
MQSYKEFLFQMEENVRTQIVKYSETGQ